ncbi:unnamed protein product [Thelazia callipaeda]|uniref:FYVE-type domain-containing protein n=1 Tax=Thelazia callipaeda TaxID=103827 RepID=A0A0N5CNX6_THECL|nr:unnamed protein product [Thelazia callipaeda]
MLEKVLWHGFIKSAQKTMIVMRSPEFELWNCLGKVASVNVDMNDSYQCINHLDNISTPLIRIRAFMRLAVMQKKLGSYFEVLTSSRYISFVLQHIFREFYEPWALIRHEECVGLSGLLMALSVLDCNLEVDQSLLEKVPGTVELSVYVSLSNILDESSAEKESYASNAKLLELALDQKNFLEERNNNLELKVVELKKKLELTNSSSINKDNVKHSFITFPCFITSVSSVFKSSAWLGNFRARLAQLTSEKDDFIRILRQQLTDTEKVNVDLHRKIRVVEEQCRALKKDLTNENELHIQEREQKQQLIDSLIEQNSIHQSKLAHEIGASVTLKKELVDKTEQYMQAINVLERKQLELSAANDKLGKLQRQNSNLNEELKQLLVLKQEFEELTVSYEYKSRKLIECEKALEELGGHLSESKWKVVELKEKFLPFLNAEWEKDGDVVSCKGCNLQFSVSIRKHHCRNCGSIFCNSCTDSRIKLPSNAKPVRVCSRCFILLLSRHDSPSEDNSSSNS